MALQLKEQWSVMAEASFEMNNTSSKLKHKVSSGGESTSCNSDKADKIVDWLQGNGIKSGVPETIFEEEEDKRKQNVLIRSENLRDESCLLQKRARCKSPPPLSIRPEGHKST